ncbi:Indolepyruvate oxidoreductase subunit IorA [Tepidanaerobacter acetatoxydans Re1]|uniref:Indolepyruvate oxidoreductase subunit IorA n=1 Tax=Tepidanaerobacter acetatoxydans (strain DSM 21804 / JCM 16047 / Re1) TaxID=1209989 RepID=F4LS13_TEPAE|nr:indolepyruvate ferredoxin oxidoreductase subunit alpha [Tepidanaerobacter acetatoxydans]AEE92352.1 indolepyruvate ferredoxin oxidoreductase, alpha subunit [Tepidanaerobacter acetatoxydans Re1]CCP27240.1 Indolepyruvate oxidoreductase subunit IorA [Tepidanaerobacter acetatoxydans Re1]
MKQLMTGNEAIARGVYEGGCHFASAYPGTPSTEILENLIKYKEVKSEWAPNEKVAMEAAIGASIAGGRAFAAMKHVGLNVGADPLFTYAYMGVNGGFVFVSADDPGMHSSQNEQDNRNYAPFAKIAMLEPSNSQECYEMSRDAFELSEKYNTTIMIRTTTRVNHSKSLVKYGERKEVKIKDYNREMGRSRFDAVPALSKKLRIDLEARLKLLAEYSEESPYNFIEWNDKNIGIITSGVSYNYAKEVFGNKASYFKLGFTYPLPLKKIAKFAQEVNTLYVIEELDPYLENQLKAAGISCIGKEKIPNINELTPNIIAEVLLGKKTEIIKVDSKNLIDRPPMLCAGCPHRGFFYELGKVKNIMIASDIGCYGLGGSEPLNAKDTCICMGGSAGTGHGAQTIFNKKEEGKRVVAVMGDSTFFATGLNGVENALYNGSNLITAVLDNRTTAMTGHQENPGTGYTAGGHTTTAIQIEDVVRALGCNNIRTFNPHNLKETKETIQWALNLNEASVIIARYPCALKKYSKEDIEIFGGLNKKYEVDEEICNGCRACTRTGCPAINFSMNNKKSYIDQAQCIGCSVCAQVCPVNAIHEKGE